MGWIELHIVFCWRRFMDAGRHPSDAFSDIAPWLPEVECERCFRLFIVRNNHSVWASIRLQFHYVTDWVVERQMSGRNAPKLILLESWVPMVIHCTRAKRVRLRWDTMRRCLFLGCTNHYE